MSLLWFTTRRLSLGHLWHPNNLNDQLPVNTFTSSTKNPFPTIKTHIIQTEHELCINAMATENGTTPKNGVSLPYSLRFCQLLVTHF